jgi:hypothetical protein
MDGVDFPETVTSQEIPRAESLYNSHNIQFRVITVDKGAFVMENSIPNFTEHRWNYAQAFLPEFQKVVWLEA